MDTEEILKDVRLRFTTDQKPGYTRKTESDKFVYYDLESKKIEDQETIDRIHKLVIPPAYTRVWICQYANGHLQATGFDNKKRKQYRYHPLWIKVSQQAKFAHVLEFAEHLPKIRSQARKDMSLSGMPREKILATVVWLLENTLIRIGNEEYEKENKSYGLTTFKNKHATVNNQNQIAFQFKGKSGIYHKVKIQSKKVAKIIRKCKDLPGQDLFEYKDDNGKIQTVTSSDVNEYLQKITGTETTAKDFRTWGGTVLAATALDKYDITKDESETKKSVVETVKKVAGQLRNKPATCKKYYIHPAIIDAFSQGHIISRVGAIVRNIYKDVEGLDEKENSVVALLSHMLSLDKSSSSSSIVRIYVGDSSAS